jgi:hypothetical protein
MDKHEAQLESPSLKVRSTVSHLPKAERRRALRLLEAWIKQERVTPYEDRDPCLLELADPQHKCHPSGWCLRHSPEYQPSASHEGFAVLDHPEWWQNAQGRFISTAHPYHLSGLGALFKWGEANGISVAVYPPRNSWYYPDRTQLIVLRGKPVRESTGVKEDD